MVHRGRELGGVGSVVHCGVSEQRIRLGLTGGLLLFLCVCVCVCVCVRRFRSVTLCPAVTLYDINL